MPQQVNRKEFKAHISRFAKEVVATRPWLDWHLEEFENPQRGDVLFLASFVQEDGASYFTVSALGISPEYERWEIRALRPDSSAVPGTEALRKETTSAQAAEHFRQLQLHVRELVRRGT